MDDYSPSSLKPVMHPWIWNQIKVCQVACFGLQTQMKSLWAVGSIELMKTYRLCGNSGLLYFIQVLTISNNLFACGKIVTNSLSHETKIIRPFLYNVKDPLVFCIPCWSYKEDFTWHQRIMEADWLVREFPGARQWIWTLIKVKQLGGN